MYLGKLPNSKNDSDMTKFKGVNGDYLVQCDISGFVCLASETKMQWDGLRVKAEFWSRRQPQDFVTAPADRLSIPNARPMQPVPVGQDLDVNNL